MTAAEPVRRGSRLRLWFCDVLCWHGRLTNTGRFVAIYPEVRCGHCGRTGLLDSNGEMF
jgi:hypothetical protein